jgi:hypothetical protein
LAGPGGGTMRGIAGAGAVCTTLKCDSTAASMLRAITLRRGKEDLIFSVMSLGRFAASSPLVPRVMIAGNFRNCCMVSTYVITFSVLPSERTATTLLRWLFPMECVETTCAVDMAAPFGHKPHEVEGPFSSFESDMRDEGGVTDKAAVAVMRFRTNLKTD